MNNRVEFEGHCAFAVSTGKTEVKGGANTSTINGKVYAFSNPIARLLFKILPGRIKKAEQVWNNRNQVH